MAFVSMVYKIGNKYCLLMFLFTFVFGRGIKYTLYDSAKEIATIPFRNDIKRIGRVLDMLGVGTGRFLAHLFPVILFTTCPYSNYDNFSDVLTFLYLIIVVLFYVVSNRLCKYTTTPLQ
jgi:ATP/ADP translocase